MSTNDPLLDLEVYLENAIGGVTLDDVFRKDEVLYVRVHEEEYGMRAIRLPDRYQELDIET